MTQHLTHDSTPAAQGTYPGLPWPTLLRGVLLSPDSAACFSDVRSTGTGRYLFATGNAWAEPGSYAWAKAYRNRSRPEGYRLHRSLGAPRARAAYLGLWCLWMSRARLLLLFGVWCDRL